MDLNNRRTGKHATKPRALGLLGHSVHVQYESQTSSGLKVIAKVKVFVHAANADTRARTGVPGNQSKGSIHERSQRLLFG